MNRRNLLWVLLALPLAAVGGWTYANSASTYTCPITGEQLPCGKCCPLNQTAATEPKTEKPQAADDYVCPVTGETLNCEKCCPLNK